jgi:hypothetical protein
MKMKKIKEQLQYLLEASNRHEAVLQEMRKEDKAELDNFADMKAKQRKDEAIETAIIDIMNNFNFGKVHEVMTALNWQWRDIGVPTIEQIQKEAKSLLTDMMEQEYLQVRHWSTGGFNASYEDDTISLKFVVENWYSEINEETVNL